MLTIDIILEESKNFSNLLDFTKCFNNIKTLMFLNHQRKKRKISYANTYFKTLNRNSVKILQL